MIIGIDLDNTIITYDSLFYKYAVEYELIDSNTLRDKKNIRDSIRKNHGDEMWTELQGKIYGEKMNEAEFAEGFLSFFQFTSEKKIKICIVSHKSKFSASKTKYNLHKSVMSWFEQNREIFQNHKTFQIQRDLYLEPSLQSKILRITQLSCDYFIDDLEEVLTNKNFPIMTKKIHYLAKSSKEDESSFHDEMLRFSHWHDIQSFFEKTARCSKN